MSFPIRRVLSHIRIGDTETVREALEAAPESDFNKKLLSDLMITSLKADSPEMFYILEGFFSGREYFVSCVKEVFSMIPRARAVNAGSALVSICAGVTDKGEFRDLLDMLLYKTITEDRANYFINGIAAPADTPVVELLIRSGADVNRHFNFPDIKSDDSRPPTALMAALKYCDTASALAIVESPGFDAAKHQDPAKPYSVLAEILSINSLEDPPSWKMKRMHRPVLAPSNVRLLKTFLSKGGDPDFMPPEKRGVAVSMLTPLSVAAMYNDYESLMILLNAGADPSKENRNCKPLAMIAAEAGNPDIANELEKYIGQSTVRKNITAHDKKLIETILCKDTDRIKETIRAGADVNFIERPNKNRKTAFAYAAASCAEPRVFRTLFDAGLDPNIQDRYGHTAFNLISMMLLPNSKKCGYTYARTPYYNDVMPVGWLYDIQNGSVPALTDILPVISQVLDMAIEAGCGMQNRSFCTFSSAQRELNRDSYGDQLYIISSGLPFALVNAFNDTFNNDEYSKDKPLCPDILRQIRCTDDIIAAVFRKMLNAGLDPNMRINSFSAFYTNNFKKNTYSLIHSAVAAGLPQTVRALIEAGADPGLADTIGRSPLVFAIPDLRINSRLEPLNHIRYNLMNPNNKQPRWNNDEQTAGYIADTTGEIVDILIDAGADVSFGGVPAEVLGSHDNKQIYENCPVLSGFVENLENYALNRRRLKEDKQENQTGTGFEFDI